MKFSTAIVFLTTTMAPTATVVQAFMAPHCKNAAATSSGIKVTSSLDIELQKELSKRPVFDPLGLYPTTSKEYQEGRRGVSLFSDDANNDIQGQMLSQQRNLYDPLRLYPLSSFERQNNLIQPLEDEAELILNSQPVTDPLNLYKDDKATNQYVKMSKSLPFLVRPEVLDGTLVGDVGFDPLGLANTNEKLLQLRDSELKHSRIAMLAAIGWPLSELWNKGLASTMDLKPILGLGDRVPSVLNGGLEKVSPTFWVAALSAASLVEIYKLLRETNPEYAMEGGGVEGSNESKNMLFGGKLNFNMKDMELSEIKHGRLAMLAITGFAMAEFVNQMSVVNLTPLFFHPITEMFQAGVSSM